MTARPILRASMSWAERHRPKDLDDIVANPTAVAELRKWAAAWQRGRPDKKAVILQGPPGIGKTSCPRPREGDGLERRRDECLGQPERGGDSEGRDSRGRPPDLQRFRRIPPGGPRRTQADRPR